LGVFIIAIAPGICEEVMFRGTISRAYDSLGYKRSIIITAVLFGIFHFNAMNLVGPIFLGIILGILVHKTNSIYASMLGHTLNNGIALTIGFLVTKFVPALEEVANEGPMIPENIQFLVSLIIFGILGFISLSVLLILLKRFPMTNRTNDFSLSESTYPDSRFKFMKYLPLLIVFVIFIILNIKMLFNV
jgi:hypothetical protein